MRNLLPAASTSLLCGTVFIELPYVISEPRERVRIATKIAPINEYTYVLAVYVGGGSVIVLRKLHDLHEDRFKDIL